VARKGRSQPQFNLAFLDVMCCGFGAVVLLVMLLNGKMLTTRREVVAGLQSEVTRLEQEVAAGREYLVALRDSLERTDREIARTTRESRQVLERITRVRAELAELRRTSRAERRHVKALQSDLLKLEERQRRLAARQQAAAGRGQQVRQFIGQGDRQYLTGLRLGGRRVLLLVDASASMLDETILNVLVRRNLSAAERRGAPKWQRALKTVEWLTANLPADSRLQILPFNSAVRPLPGRAAGWVEVGDRAAVDRLLAGLRRLVPEGGTSLYHAFAAAARLQPPPDNILLLTDGLPTRGAGKPAGTTVSGERRLKLFQEAVGRLPKGVPVNTILFPMEGDPLAAVSFWQLGLETGGSFLTPAGDWP